MFSREGGLRIRLLIGLLFFVGLDYDKVIDGLIDSDGKCWKGQRWKEEPN